MDSHRDDDRDGSAAGQHAELVALLAATARRDAAAFRRLYSLSSAKLFGLAIRIVHRAELAEEVLQDSFVNIWHAAPGYQAALAAPMTWLATIVRNKALDLLRKPEYAHRALELDRDDQTSDLLDLLAHDTHTPADALGLSRDARALAQCLEGIDARQRQIIALAYFRDLSHGEIAAQAMLPIGTVKTWIRRGLQALRACLDAKKVSS